MYGNTRMHIENSHIILALSLYSSLSPSLSLYIYNYCYYKNVAYGHVRFSCNNVVITSRSPEMTNA